VGERTEGSLASAVNLVLRPAAVADIRAACKYYEEATSGLVEDLAHDLDRLFARIEAFPKSARPVAGYEPVRRARLRRSLYAVFYRPGVERIEVLRIIHRSP